MRKVYWLVMLFQCVTLIAVANMVAIGYFHDYQKPLPLPLAYRSAIWFDPAFRHEQDLLKTTLNPDGFVVNADQEGQYINIKAGRRRTIGNPKHPEHTIWILGSSVVFGWSVADGDTIPSKLQADLNQTSVINMGASGYTLEETFMYLKSLPIEPDDMVIVFGGDMDGLQLVHGKMCHGTPFPLFQMFLCPMQFRVDDNEARDYAQGYVNVLRQAYSYTEGKGAKFLAVLEPNITSRPLSIQETIVAGNPMYLDGYQVSRQFIDAESRKLSFILDLSTAFDSERARGEEFFFDTSHFDEAGNQLVADRLYQYIRKNVTRFS